MEILSLEKLIAEWHTDSKIDLTEPGQALLKNPNLHAKYAEQLCRRSLALKSTKQSHASLRRIRADYYNGRMSQADLAQRGLQAFPFVLAKDIGLYLDADPELQASDKKISVHEEAIIFLMSIIKAINTRSFDIRGYIDWVKYTQGGGSV